MSAWTYRRSTARPPLRLFHLVFEPHDGSAFCSDSEEKRVSDIDTAVLDSLKVLDPNRPIREADIAQTSANVRLTQSRPARRAAFATQHLDTQSVPPSKRATLPIVLKLR